MRICHYTDESFFSCLNYLLGNKPFVHTLFSDNCLIFQRETILFSQILPQKSLFCGYDFPPRPSFENIQYYINANKAITLILDRKTVGERKILKGAFVQSISWTSWWRISVSWFYDYLYSLSFHFYFSLVYSMNVWKNNAMPFCWALGIQWQTRCTWSHLSWNLKSGGYYRGGNRKFQYCIINLFIDPPIICGILFLS